MRKNTAMIIRCQKFGKKEKLCYEFFKDTFSNNIFISLNASDDSVSGLGKANFVNWNFKKISHEGWPRINLGWRCGDINFYQISKKFKKYDYYWMCEPDVFFHNISSKEFFAEFDEKEEDYLAVSIEKKDNDWHWFRHSAILDRNVYGSFFCLLRLSRRAIEFLYSRRLQLLELFKKKNLNTTFFPNDEGFVSTSILNESDLSYRSIDEDNPQLYEFFKTDPQSAFFEENLSTVSDPKVIHRLMTKDEFIGKQAGIIVPDGMISHKAEVLNKIKANINDSDIIDTINQAINVRMSLEIKK